MFEKVSAEQLAGMETLARRVRSELAAAGLPVPAPGLSPVLAGGAEVEVDDGADTAGGVFGCWTTTNLNADPSTWTKLAASAYSFPAGVRHANRVAPPCRPG